MKYIGVGLVCIGMAGAALAIGNIFGSLLRSLAMSPMQRDVLMSTAILGFALAEAIALFSLLLGCVMLFTN